MELTTVQKALILCSYENGYERGHNDTVESQYSDPQECAEDWLNDAIEDGGLEYEFTRAYKRLEAG